MSEINISIVKIRKYTSLMYKYRFYLLLHFMVFFYKLHALYTLNWLTVIIGRAIVFRVITLA